MQHEEMMKNDPEYARTYEIMLKEDLSIAKIMECVIKSNRIIGVGLITLKQQMEDEINKYIGGY